MQDASDEGFQLATLVVIVLIVLVVIAYLLIYVNPSIALNPFKPQAFAKPTVAIAVIPTLPPTWTPLPTDTEIPTRTPTATSTPTLLPLPTNPPTAAPTATSRPPTRTPGAVPPTPIPLPYTYKPVGPSCTHSGSTVIKGKVTRGGSPVDGIHVLLGTSSDPASVQEDQIVKRDGNGTTSYAFVIGAPDSGAFAWHVWIKDDQGTLLSDPSFQFTINTLPDNDPASCWLAVLDFVQ
ncbi:MAG TPA: hypothetical protein VF478_00655 [Anaerolineae bacterium]